MLQRMVCAPHWKEFLTCHTIFALSWLLVLLLSSSCNNVQKFAVGTSNIWDSFPSFLLITRWSIRPSNVATHWNGLEWRISGILALRIKRVRNTAEICYHDEKEAFQCLLNGSIYVHKYPFPCPVLFKTWANITYMQCKNKLHIWEYGVSGDGIHFSY